MYLGLILVYCNKFLLLSLETMVSRTESTTDYDLWVIEGDEREKEKKSFLFLEKGGRTESTDYEWLKEMRERKRRSLSFSLKKAYNCVLL